MLSTRSVTNLTLSSSAIEESRVLLEHHSSHLRIALVACNTAAAPDPGKRRLQHLRVDSSCSPQPSFLRPMPTRIDLRHTFEGLRSSRPGFDTLCALRDADLRASGHDHR